MTQSQLDYLLLALRQAAHGTGPRPSNVEDTAELRLGQLQTIIDAACDEHMSQEWKR